MMTRRKVSIIIPFYNAQASVSVSLRSVLAQSYSNIELVLINDCSTDASVEVVQGFENAFLEKGVEYCLYNHEVNQGVAVARNTGLEHATGDFVYFLDADDWIESEAIEALMTEAVRSSSDIVGCNWFLSFDKNERKMNQPAFSSPWEAIQMILCGRMRWNLWIFLVRRELYEQNRIRFIPEKNIGEDLLVTLKLFLNAQKVSFVDRALYHYSQGNEESLTKVYSDRHIQEVTYNVNEAKKELEKSPYADRLKNEVHYLKLHIKLPLLISASTGQYKRWLNWFPESHPYISENKTLPWRIRFLQQVAVKEHFWIIKLHYFLVVKIVYGVIYR